MLNKKGISAVITTVLLIFLVVLAMGIFYGAVKVFFDKKIEQTQAGVSQVSLNILDGFVETGVIDPDSEEEAVKVRVRREVGEGNLVKIRFEVSDGDGIVSSEFETKMNILEEEMFYVRTGGLEVKTISVVPVIETSSGEEIYGSVSDIYEIEG